MPIDQLGPLIDHVLDRKPKSWTNKTFAKVFSNVKFSKAGLPKVIPYSEIAKYFAISARKNPDKTTR